MKKTLKNVKIVKTNILSKTTQTPPIIVVKKLGHPSYQNDKYTQTTPLILGVVLPVLK